VSARPQASQVWTASRLQARCLWDLQCAHDLSRRDSKAKCFVSSLLVASSNLLSGSLLLSSPVCPGLGRLLAPLLYPNPRSCSVVFRTEQEDPRSSIAVADLHQPPLSNRIPLPYAARHEWTLCPCSLRFLFILCVAILCRLFVVVGFARPLLYNVVSLAHPCPLFVLVVTGMESPLTLHSRLLCDP
jgi:hypothetical protein